MSRRRLSVATGLLVALATVPAAQAQEAGKPLLPGGASSIQESYGDWRVLCNVVSQTKQCAMNQQRIDAKGGQLVVAVSLTPTGNGGASGSLLMPFGLDLGAGVSLSLDDGSGGKPVGFKTCMPRGCFVPLAFDAGTVSTLRAGKELRLTVRAADSTDNKPTVFSLVLNGFGPAFDRTSELLK